MSAHLLARLPRATAIPAAERRARAVRALVELAEHTAPDQISTAAVAEAMGVSHAALFRHFPNREALWAEAVHWATGELRERLNQACAADADPLEAIEALLRCHAGFHQHHPGLMRMLFAELQRPQSSPAREQGKRLLDEFLERLAVQIEAAQRRGQLDPARPTQELAGLLLAANQGLLLQALVHGRHDQLQDRSGASVRLILNGARR